MHDYSKEFLTDKRDEFFIGSLIYSVVCAGTTTTTASTACPTIVGTCRLHHVQQLLRQKLTLCLFG